MVAKNVKVSNGLLINLAYDDVDISCMSSIYAIYNFNTDKFSLHIPITVASTYCQTLSHKKELL